MPQLIRDQKFLINYEYAYLHQRATKSNSPQATKRQYEETGKRGRYRTPFQRDRDRIIHSEAFRALMYKSQVFPCPLQPQYRTRLTHTLEVSQIARAISRRFGFNEDLTEAIALGHDLGHPPFGHKGEDILRKLLIEEDQLGFEHNEYSLEIVDTKEKCDTIDGIKKGMNLTRATRQGILCHTRYEEAKYPSGRQIRKEWKDLVYSSKEEWFDREANGDDSLLSLLTPEAQIVDIADEVAYLTHDLEDCWRARIIKRISDVPGKLRGFVGAERKDNINAMINDICEASRDNVHLAGENPKAFVKIEYPHETRNLVRLLKQYFDNEIFSHEKIKLRIEEGQTYIKKLYEYWKSRPPNDCSANPRDIINYIARKSDQEIIHHHQDIFHPRFVNNLP